MDKNNNNTPNFMTVDLVRDEKAECPSNQDLNGLILAGSRSSTFVEIRCHPDSYLRIFDYLTESWCRRDVKVIASI
jgi:hypothetical protein